MTWCTVLIIALSSAGLIGLYLALCQSLPKQSLPSAATTDDDAYLAMFAVAHHDIWWAKEHVWTIVIAALATLIAVLLVDFSGKPAALLRFLSGALVTLAAASNWYVGRMQSDMAVARIRSAFLVRRCAKLSRVVDEVVAGDLTDYNRGYGFMVALVVLTSAVGATPIWILQKSTVGALVTYFALLVWGLGWLFFQVKRRAAREKAIASRAA